MGSDTPAISTENPMPARCEPPEVLLGGVGCRSRSRQTENPVPTTLVRLGSFQKSQMEVQHGLSRTAPPSGQQ